MYQNLQVSRDGEIAVVAVNRPKALNALNTDTLKELGAAVEEVRSDPAVRGVIITGAGNRAFVAGADIGELAAKDPIAAREFVQLGQGVLNRIESSPKLVVAAVNGYALGGGCELAMACHIRAAAAQAQFGQPEVGLGIIPGFGGTQRLPRLVGKGRALEMLIGGAPIDAAEAFRIGLVNCVIPAWKTDETGREVTDDKGRRVFDSDKFLGEVKRMVKGFLTKGPAATALIIEAVNRGLEVPLAEGLALEADLFGVVYATPDRKEGLAAFLEKRAPKFS